jgi:chemotaxis protein MotA
MILIIGYLIVLGATLGGFLEAGGKIGLLFPLSEYIIIVGISTGLMVIASPVSLLKNIVKKIKIAFRSQAVPTSDYTDLLKLLYELFTKARRGGLIAIEDDVMSPKDSPILSKYPSFINDHERLEFTNSLKPVIDGRLKPEQLGGLLHADLEAKEEDAIQPVHILNLVGDSLPGIGIVAAVMGIINTMAAIAMGPEKVGAKVASALVGTFLGVLEPTGSSTPRRPHQAQQCLRDSVLCGHHERRSRLHRWHGPDHGRRSSTPRHRSRLPTHSGSRRGNG